MAFGTIAIDTLSTSGQISGTAKTVDSDYLASGSARAWINLSMSGGSITDSFSFSSVTDVAVGRFTCTMSIALGNATYSVASDSTFVSGACNAVCLRDDQVTRTTTVYQIFSSQSNAGTATDSTSVMSQIQGDLA